MTTATTQILRTEVRPGHIIHAYGARFQVVETIRHADCQANLARWLDGATFPGYFGPDCEPFNFQGNELATISVEVTTH